MHELAVELHNHIHGMTEFAGQARRPQAGSCMLQYTRSQLNQSYPCSCGTAADTAEFAVPAVPSSCWWLTIENTRFNLTLVTGSDT
jgi:hypothetical protein